MTTPDWTLRPARPGDQEFLRSLHELSYREHVERVWGWDDGEQAGYFERRFQPERLQIVQASGEDVGVLSVEDRDDELFLADVEIHPRWQGRGIGSSIVRSLQDQARSAGKPLTLQVLHVNTRARALYERLGFGEVWRDEIRSRMRWRPPRLVASDR
jgi:ribosomal protein S18 acetylase RimI-like enzyme